MHTAPRAAPRPAVRPRRSIPVHRRALPLCAVIVALTGGLAACTNSDGAPSSAVEAHFAEALSRQDAVGAARMTTDPDAAAPVLQQAFAGLSAKSVHFTAHSETTSSADNGAFTMAAAWHLGVEGTQSWDYTVSGAATHAPDGWAITWDPALVAPQLRVGQRLRYTTTASTPPAITDAAGATLMSPQVVTLVTINPRAADPTTATAVARLLSPIDPTLTTPSIQADITAGQSQPATIITLRAADIAPVHDQLTAIAGVELVAQTKLLTTDKSLGSPALDGVTKIAQHTADTAGGWAVQLLAADNSATTIAGHAASDPASIATTLSSPIQNAAQAAIAPLTHPAAIVAIEASTGAVLAVAQNTAANQQGPIALTGLYPPGSTFKSITTAAALESGHAQPDTMLPCPGRADIEGRSIPNENQFDLGTVPLHTAYAQSCNTTMAELADALPPEALQQTTRQLGLGIDYTTPGLTTVTGTVPVNTTPAEKVESAIGQGKDLASPFGMTLTAATIANGTTPTPTLLPGQPATTDRQPPPLPGSITTAIQAMMRETVTSGTATVIKDIPDVMGKTGTAEFGDNTHAHGWFIGIDHNLAFTVFIDSADNSTPAVQTAGQFLRPIQDNLPH